MLMRRQLKAALTRLPLVRGYFAEKQALAIALNEAVVGWASVLAELADQRITTDAIASERDAALEQAGSMRAHAKVLSAQRDILWDQLVPDRSITATWSGAERSEIVPHESLRADSAVLKSIEFGADDFPGNLRILFIGHAISSHTHSWLDLLQGSGINVRFFSPFFNDSAPENFHVRTYLSIPGVTISTPLRLSMGDAARETDWSTLRDTRLAAVVEQWRPHLVHTLGLFNSGVLWHAVSRRFEFTHRPRWVLQLRGGSDLEINRHVPAKRSIIAGVSRAADQIISDNLSNFRYLHDLGVDERSFASIAPVPGTGGVDVPATLDRLTPPSQRRTILWPKAYNSQFALAIPVLEALRLIAEELPPCRIVILCAEQPEVIEWIKLLPPSLQAICDVRPRVARSVVLGLMKDARILLAPSLVDGRPNSMLEAMASGAFPIVSPLPTIREVVKEPDHVLFARNLYPGEIAAALLRAMRDDELLDRASVQNLRLVRKIANRADIRQSVVTFYRDMSGQGGGC